MMTQYGNGIHYNKKELFSTDKIESYTNYFAYRLFDTSLQPNSTVIGKEDFLFLGNTYDNVVLKTGGKFRPAPDAIEAWTDRLKTLQEWYGQQGIKFIIAVAPNKHTIYKEKLPEWLVYNGKNITDDIVESAARKNIRLLDLRKPMLEAKAANQDDLYFKTDTHWNTKGASIAFEKTIDFFNRTYSTHLRKPEYTLASYKRVAGDLAGFLKISSILGPNYEQGFFIKFKKKRDFCKGNINTQDAILEVCSPAPNSPVDVFIPNYIQNPAADNPYKVLFIGDSFSTAPSPLYNATFNTIWRWHHTRLKGTKLARFVKENKPDIVIYHIVERALYNEGNDIVSELPL